MNIFRNIKRVVQDQTKQSPWMLRDEIGLQINARFAAVAQDFAAEQDQANCDALMNMTGSYDGIKRKHTLIFSSYQIMNVK